MLLAFDDTDGPRGGCTTHLAFHVLLALPEMALRSLPRLVRLNPNVPWKTRGNAAVVLDLGAPEGPQVRVGELRGREVLAFPESPPASATEDVLDRAWRAVSKQAQSDAHPAVALFDEAPPALWYDAGVRTLVSDDDARDGLAATGALWRAVEGGHASVGCLAAAAWPGPPTSYEFTAYREPSRWGTPRAVDPAPLRGLDETGACFHTWDALEDVPVCIPGTPCPVLLGLRGRDPDTLRGAALRAVARAALEPVDGWLLWATNQASGDHVTPVASLLEAPDAGTVQCAATVVDRPAAREGGHVFVAMEDATGIAFTAAAFEPTKRFRDIVRALAPGGEVTVVGAFAKGVVRLEKLEVRHLATVPRKGPNPLCECGDRMKSKGRGAGYRCPSCGKTAGPEAMLGASGSHTQGGDSSKTPRTPGSKTQGGDGPGPHDRGVSVGWHEVPIKARRHLHRPVAWGPPAVTSVVR